MIFILLAGLCYGILYSMLSLTDDTPRWGSITTPDALVIGYPWQVKVAYHKLEGHCSLGVYLSFHDQERRYCGQMRTRNSPVNIKGTGVSLFVFEDIQPPGQAITVRVNALLQESISAGSDQKDVSKRIVGRPIYSEQIPIVSENTDGTLNLPARAPLQQIIKKAVEQGYWRRFAGDRTAIGWSITAAYLMTSILGFICIRQLRHNAQGTSGYLWFWWIISLTMLALGLNKQLDLQMLLADIARTYAKERGWYGHRRPFQIQAISILATTGWACLIIMVYALRRAPRTTWLTLLGMIMLCSFVGLRMVSFHTFDVLMRRPVSGIRLIDILELGGILCVAVSMVSKTISAKSSK